MRDMRLFWKSDEIPFVSLCLWKIQEKSCSGHILRKLPASNIRTAQANDLRNLYEQ